MLDSQEEKLIYFEENDIQLLKEKIYSFARQNIQVITSPKYAKWANEIYNAIKREFIASISYISSQSCYNIPSINILSASQKENARVIVAIGDEYIHNVAKAVSQKTCVPYCFLGLDYPDIYAMKNYATIVGGEIYAESLPLFINYKPSCFCTQTAGQVMAQCFSLAILPFLDFLSSKLEFENVSTNFNNSLLYEIQKIINLAKGIELDSDTHKIKLAKTIINISKLLDNKPWNKALFQIPFEYVVNNKLDVQDIPLYHFFTFQVLLKIFSSYFHSSTAPLGVTLEQCLAVLKNPALVRERVQTKLNSQKLNYIFSCHARTIQNFLLKLNSLNISFLQIIRNTLTDSGYNAFKKLNFTKLINHTKYHLLKNSTPPFSLINLIEII